MLVQAQVVPWWGTGRPAEFSPSGSNPVRGIAHRQEDRRVRLQNRVVSTTARRATRTLSRNEKFEFFWCPSPGGRSVREITSHEETERPPEESARQIPACSRLSQEPKACWRSGSADRTAPEQVWQAPGLREFRFAVSQQILPLIANRKPASDRGHWLEPAPCSSRRRSCPGGERGDRQSSVPANPTPSQTQPSGRRIAGYDYKTESFQRPRVEHYTHFREMRNSNFFWCPSPGGRSVREITSHEETERPPEESARQIPACSRLSQEPKACWRSGSADRTAPEQISQAPGLREFRLAASQQILPLIGNRKPASDRGHWLQPVPCSSRRGSCPGGERGDRQSSVPAEPTRHGHRLPAGG